MRHVSHAQWHTGIGFGDSPMVRVRVARERRSRSTGTSFPLLFFCILQLLTVIFYGSPSVIKLISLLPAFMHVNNNVYVYDIMDDTSAMWDNWPIMTVDTQNCFSTLFYTPYTNIKTSAQNAPKCTIARQKIKKFSGEAAQPSALGVPVPFHLRFEHC